MHYWADASSLLCVVIRSSQDRSHRIRRKRASINYGALVDSSKLSYSKSIAASPSRKKTKLTSKKKRTSPLEQPSTVLKEQESNPSCTDTIHEASVIPTVPLNQPVQLIHDVPSRELPDKARSHESDSAVELLVSLRNMDQRNPSAEVSTAGVPLQQPNTPNQVILSNYILVPCIPTFTLTRLSV